MEEKNINYVSYIEENINKNILYSEYISEYVDKNISYADYICGELDKNISYADYLEENLSDIFESKKYLMSLHTDKILYIIMEMYNISEKDLEKLNLVKLKVRDFKINSLLKEDYKK